MLQVVDLQVMAAVKTYQIMPVPLVIAKKQILAVNRTIVTPPAAGLLNRLSLRMRVAGEGDVVTLKKGEDRLSARRDGGIYSFIFSVMAVVRAVFDDSLPPLPAAPFLYSRC